MRVTVCVPVQSSTDAEPLYVVEVLLHCSKESVKDSATEAAKPSAPGEVGEMQVGAENALKQTHHAHAHTHHSWSLQCDCHCSRLSQ